MANELIDGKRFESSYDQGANWFVYTVDDIDVDEDEFYDLKAAAERREDTAESEYDLTDYIAAAELLRKLQ